MLDRIQRFAQKPKILLLAGAFSVLAVWVQANFYLFTPDRIIDSYSYYFAARALNEGLNPYDGALLEEMGQKEYLKPHLPNEKQENVYPYLYPPPLAGFWRLFTLLPPLSAHRVVVAFDALLIGLILYLLARSISITHHRHALLLIFILFQTINGAAITSTRLGQINLLILVLLLAALHFHLRQTDLFSALCLTLAILIKITPIFIMLYFILYYRRRWQYIGWMAFWGVVVIGISLRVAPPATWLQFFQSSTSGPPLYSEFSIWGWLTIHGQVSDFIYENKVWLYLVMAIPLLLLTLRSIRKINPAERPAYAFSLLIMLSLLLSPLTWHHHYVFYTLPGFYLLTYHWNRRHRFMIVISALLVFLVLLRLPGPFHMIRPICTLLTMVFAFRSWRQPDETIMAASTA